MSPGDLDDVRSVVAVQGAYYLVTGAWAVVDRRTFEAVTGPKTDYWLVRTVGLLAAAVGASLLVGARDRRPAPPTAVLAVGAAAAFTGVDVACVARRRISPIYLADTVVHAVLGVLALRRGLRPAQSHLRPGKA